MAKNKNNLTHHEALRLDYLNKNIHYLNEKDKRELAYLLYKKDLPTGHRELEEDRKYSFSESSYEEPSYDDDFILPEYPRQERRRSSRKRSQKSVKLPTQSPIRPFKKKRGRLKRLFLFLVMAFIFLIGGLIFSFYKGHFSVEQKPIPEVFNGVDSPNGINILILGTDGRIGESSEQTRTDSIMVLNINNLENKVKLVSFMRDILIDIEGYDYKLNTAYTLGEQDNLQGAEEVRKALKNNFDIDIKYYAMVDFATFASGIDTLFPEGVTIDAQFATVNGEPVSAVEVPDDLNMVDGIVPNQTIAVGLQQMDGRTLLNYARFRKDDEGDFGRTKRQQEVLSAVITQSKNPMKLFAGSEALGKVYAMTPTTVPQGFMWLQGPGMILDAANGIERITIPEEGDWVEDFDIYEGLGLRIDFVKYQEKLASLGFR